MKKFISVIILSVSCALCFAQTKTSASFQLFINDLSSCKTLSAETPSFLHLCSKYPITEYQNKQYVSVLAIINPSFSSSDLKKMGVRIGSIIGDYATLRLPINLLNQDLILPGVEYIELAAKFHPTLDKALKDTRVDSVHMGWYLPFPITGKNVLIGITDWGFDYTHPMFYDTSLTHTRIAAAWDQFRQSLPHPAGYDYGTVFIGETELLAAQCDTFNVYEYATHGSHVAGIAGGSGAGTPYKGVAFDAQFLMATFLVDAAAVVDAFNWMKTFAENEGKRLVINMSWGLYYMGHLDGTSLLSQIIDQMSAEGVVFVSSAGNNGDVNFHIKKDFGSAPDTMKTVIKFDSYSYYTTMWGQSISMWGTPGDSFQISIKVLDYQNNLLAETPFYSTSSALLYSEDTLIIGADTVFFNLAAEAQNPANNRAHFRLRVRNTKTSTYKIALFATATDATVHFWNLIELTNDVGNWGSDFQAPLAGWTAGDVNYGIGEPACANSVIAVAAHYSEYLMGNGTLAGGQIANFSSYGPIIDGRMKPDVSAPGVNVCSSISSFTNMSVSPISVVTSVDFLGRTYKFVRFSGTSMSSPLVTGIVALLLEANPLLTPEEIKTILHETARQDSKTGSIPPEGSPRWGHGKVNALLAIYYAMGVQHIEINTIEKKVVLEPNPASDEVVIKTSGFTPKIVYIVDSNGKLCGEYTLNSEGNTVLNIFNLNTGIYFVFLTDQQSWVTSKLIITR